MTTTRRIKYSRCLFLTLEGSENDIITGHEEEMLYIKNYFIERFNTVNYMVGCFEKHKSNLLHIHFIVYLTRASFDSNNLKDIRTYFDNWKNCKTNEIKMGDKKVTTLIGYTCKSIYTDNTITPFIYGNINMIKINKCVNQYILKVKYENEIKKECLEINNLIIPKIRTLAEQSFILDISNMMLTDGFLLNNFIDGLYNFKEDCQYEYSDLLKKWSNFNHPFFIKYALSGWDLLKRKICDKDFEGFPIWKPITTQFQLLDGTYDIVTREFKPNITDNNSIKRLNVSYNNITKRPNHYISLLFDIFRVKTEVERFRKALYNTFKPKNHRDLVLTLCGETLHGKSLIISPFELLFKNILGEWSDDDSFTVGSIASFPKVIANEVNPMEYKDIGQKIMKELLEGRNTLSKIKHKQTKISVIAKNILFILNGFIKEAHEYESMHAKAMRGRLEVFNTICGVDLNIKHYDIITTDEMLGRILYWISEDSPSYDGFDDLPLPILSEFDSKYEFDSINHPNKYIKKPVYLNFNIDTKYLV
jgi:hypothetical protein